MSRKNLYLIRHAKSSWKDTSLSDRQRPLNKRGHRNAIDMALKLAAKKTRPDLIISSTAKRAQTTSQYFAAELDYPAADIQFDERLYFCGIKSQLKLIRHLPDAANTVMLFGHNPDMSELLSYLCGEHYEAISTCTIAKLKLANWHDLRPGSAQLKFILSPKKEPKPLTKAKSKLAL